VAAAGSTATTDGVGDGATSDAAAAVGAGADSADANDRAVGPGDSGPAAGWTAASAATFASFTVCVSPLSDDGGVEDARVRPAVGAGSGEAVPADGTEVTGAMTSGDESLGRGVVESGVLSWSAVVVGLVSPDSGAPVGLVRWLVVDVP